MKILITGATGLVGSKLLEELFLKGYTDINIVTRNKKKASSTIPFPVNVYNWNPEEGLLEEGALDGVDAIIHLAGESVAEGRWTKSQKDRILKSRVLSSQLLMNKIQEGGYTPKKLVSASAIGIYGDRGNEELHETSKNGDGYLAEVCKSWESHIHNHQVEGLKSQSIRIGLVLSEDGGALQKMLPPFKAGVGGILGDGKQFMSWIHIDDLVNQFIFLLENDLEFNVFNGVSPDPVTNFDFTKTLGKVLNRPTIFPVPKFILKTIFGEMSEILIGSQKVLDHRFQENGFKYKFSTLESALEDILKHDTKGERKLKKYQWVDSKTKNVFEFFSNERNLEKITPPFLNFKVLNKSTDKIQEGTLIDYSLSLHGMPLKWKTRINAYQEEKMFIDEQLSGPYSKWIHLHEFYELDNGTLVKDEIVYKIPLGVLGRLLLGPFIKNDLKNIFNFRHQEIHKLIS